MAKGAKRQRLDAALDAARAGRVGEGELQWYQASDKLKMVAGHLRKAAERGLEIKGDTGQAMFRTMLSSAEQLERRANDMHKGEGALRDTATAIVAARNARDEIDTRLPPLTPEQFSAPDGYDDLPAWRQTEMRQNHQNTQSGLVEAREQEREDAAQQVADMFERDYQDPIKTMQEIYGYEPPPPPPPGNVPTPVYAPAGGSGTQAGGYHLPTDDGGGGDKDPDGGGKDPDGGNGDYPEPPTFTDPPVDPGTDTSDPGDGTDVSTPPPTSPWVDVPGSYGDAGPSGSGGSGTSVSPAVLGAGAGVVTAGALGAAVRGGLASGGVSALRNLTSRGGPLGGTARGAGPVLGRGGGVGGAGSPVGARGTGAAGRGAGGLRSGAGTGTGAGRGGRGAGAGAGGTGAGRGRGAGGRGAGMGVGGARGRGKREEEEQQDRDLFDDGQDWIDDEGAAPGVID